MCGILGGWLDEGFDATAVRAALDSLVHRGPDDSGQYADGPALIAMRRLSIIDLTGGHQPIANEDGSIWVVCNGEIYNYRELANELLAGGHKLRTSSDTEVLLHLYEDHGERLCEKLRGMYAFALWDSRRRILLLSRDRFGKKPLYITRTPAGGLLFASELKALLPLMKHVGQVADLNHQAIYDYLSLGCVPQPATVYRGVEALPPATWLKFDGDNVQTGRYWSLDYASHKRQPYPEALERVRELVSEAVRLRLRSDVPIGIFLSGGVDSSVVAYAAAQHAGAKLRTFTVSTGDPEYDESEIAARTAKALGVENTKLPLEVAPLDDLYKVVRHFDQPITDTGAILAMAISRVARQHVTVALNGDGGDEIFCGYRRYLAAYFQDRLTWVPGRRVLAGALGGSNPQRRSLLGFGKRFFRGMDMPRGARYLVWTSDMLREDEKRAVWKGDAVRPTEEWIEEIIPPNLGGVDAQVCGDHRINLLSDQLVKMDMATMAVSLEARSPMLDHVLAEYVVSLPSSERLQRWRRKALLRDAYQGRIADEVLNGRKRGFEVPLRSWLKHDLHEVMQDSLGSHSASVRGFLDGTFVQDILEEKGFSDRNWPYIAYGLLVLELWLRELP